jgi:hypothetical protein
LDVPATVTLSVADKVGHTAEGETSVQLLDSRAPVARLVFGALHSDGTIRSGESLEIVVYAADNQRLAYIGYSGAGLRDSVPASGTLDSHAFRLTIPPSWIIQRPALTGWARDASGHVSWNPEIDTRQVPVYDWVDHPVLTVPVLPDFYLQQVLWDAKRNSVYQLRGGPEGRGRIDGIDVLSGAPLASIPLPPNYPAQVAFSVSGDSLVVVLRYEPALGVVDLLKPDRPVTVVPLQYEGAANWVPRFVQRSGEHLFVALFSSGELGRLLDVNLGTGAQVIRADIDGAAEVAPYPILLPLPDGRLFVGAETEHFGTPRFLYSPESDRFTRTSKFGPVNPSRFVTSPSGRFLMGATVYDASLDSVAQVPSWDWSDPYGIALSPDGEALYQTTQYGYQKIRLSDGLLLEQVKLATKARFLIALPDGSRLIAVGESTVMIVDLRLVARRSP